MKKVVETIHGKYSKFEVVKDDTVWSTKFYVRKNGSAFKGSYSSLAAAVAATKKAAGVQ